MEFIPISEPNIWEKELEYVTDAVKSWRVSSLWYYVEKFEKDFAKYCNVEYWISVSNGTVAIHLALVALWIWKWDEVIIPNLTFAATANAVLYTWAKPILIDCQRDTYNIDVSKIEEKITPNTKVIIPVHLYWHPCDMDEIMMIAKKHNLYVVEDCAEAHWAEYKWKKVGNLWIISCFSFYGNKTITTWEWWMCITNDSVLNKKMRELRDHGMTKERKYRHDVVGFNYRITNLQAALWCAQLEKIEEFIDIKRKNANLYTKLLSTIDWIIPPVEKNYVKNIYWMYTIYIDEKKFGISRDELIAKLKEHWIDSRQVFYPLSDMPPYKLFWNIDDLSISRDLSYNALNLPSSTKLNEKQINYICDIIKKLKK